MNSKKVSFSLLILTLFFSNMGWAQFNPPNPKEPSIQYKIELECSPQDIAWLYGAGSYDDGRNVNISAYVRNESYEFEYWELDGKVYSRNSSFIYKISTRDVKFIAHFKYNPGNPDEPSAHFMRRIYLQSSPEGVASFNFNSGSKFELGSVVPIFETYRNSGYVFKGWYEGDNLVSDKTSFDYSVIDKDVTLVARYEYSPSNPNEPGDYTPTSCELPNDSQVFDAEFRIYDLLGREMDPASFKEGPFIIREFKNGKAVRTYKVVR